MQYFYDKQIRRYLLQFLRIFADIKIRTSPENNGLFFESRVPIMQGDMSRMVASIINNNTENTNISAPAMSGYITALKMAPERRMDPMFVDKVQVSEMHFDTVANTYTNDIGNRYSLERYMPVPYNLTVKLDLITTNMDNKLQILEQICTIFNPTLELTQNENPLDWSSVFLVELKNVTWSNRNIPVGNAMAYDIATLEFEIPIWINPPAKETRQRIIEKIITKINHQDGCSDEPVGELLSTVYTTYNNLKVKISEHPSNPNLKIATLLGAHGAPSNTINWLNQEEAFGTIDYEVNKLKLKTDDSIESSLGDIYATIVEINQSNPNQMTIMVDVDSLPPTIALSPVDRIIDPTKQFPGVELPIATVNQKYMLLSSELNDDDVIIQANTYWGGIIAKQNDIIRYNGAAWEIVFQSSTYENIAHVFNVYDGNHFKFVDGAWVYTYIGVYSPGFWEISNVNLQ